MPDCHQLDIQHQNSSVKPLSVLEQLFELLLKSPGDYTVKYHNDSLYSYIELTSQFEGNVNNENPNNHKKISDEILSHDASFPSYYTAVYYVIPWTANPSIPVLYFNLYDPQCSLITKLDTIYEILVPIHYKALLSEGSLFQPSLSQTTFPFDSLPSFFLHPCQTEEYMASLASDKTLGSLPKIWHLWLQTFGSTVGLKIQ